MARSGGWQCHPPRRNSRDGPPRQSLLGSISTRSPFAWPGHRLQLKSGVDMPGITVEPVVRPTACLMRGIARRSGVPASSMSWSPILPLCVFARNLSAPRAGRAGTEKTLSRRLARSVCLLHRTQPRLRPRRRPNRAAGDAVVHVHRLISGSCARRVTDHAALNRIPRPFWPTELFNIGNPGTLQTAAPGRTEGIRQSVPKEPTPDCPCGWLMSRPGQKESSLRKAAWRDLRRHWHFACRRRACATCGGRPGPIGWTTACGGHLPNSQN